MRAENSKIPANGILVLRLSSMGDVVLATAALDAARIQSKVDWVVAREFASLLDGHPRVAKVWSFDRSSGLWDWVRLALKLRAEDYDEVIDLHCSLRTRILRLCFIGARTRWRTVAKQRVRLIGFYIFKGLWPRAWRPEPQAYRFGVAVGGSGEERPNLRHLLNSAMPVLNMPDRYICVMPGAKWPGKRWPVRFYFEVIRNVGITPVVMGSDSDRESVLLLKLFRDVGIEAIDGVGKWSLPQNARVLAGSVGFVGNDTGLSHLAEAVGVPAVVVFGPTVPEMGFGPWREGSHALGSPLWCRPCGKDGRACFRPVRRHLCLKAVEPLVVEKAIVDMSRSKA